MVVFGACGGARGRVLSSLAYSVYPCYTGYTLFFWDTHRSTPKGERGAGAATAPGVRPRGGHKSGTESGRPNPVEGGGYAVGTVLAGDRGHPLPGGAFLWRPALRTPPPDGYLFPVTAETR